MEAKTLPKKKTTINKGKIKKTIKNVLCRPDPMFWPVISMDEVNMLQSAMTAYKVSIPVYKKPHWKELKNVPKEKRPKHPAIKKVDGLIFGISECLSTLQNGQCSAIIIDSNVNPQIIVQPIVEKCIKSNVPVLCMNNLRQITLDDFGITTSCLGINTGCLLELTNEILEIAKKYKPPLRKCEQSKTMDLDIVSNEIYEDKPKEEKNTSTDCPYLYRKNKTSRVFVPGETMTPKVAKSFAGQDFIEFSDKLDDKTNSKAYLNMILKRITNNQNRVKNK